MGRKGFSDFLEFEIFFVPHQCPSGATAMIAFYPAQSVWSE